MSKSSKTETILKSKAKAHVFSENNNPGESSCLPCKGNNNSTLWRVYIHHDVLFTEMARTHDSYRVVGDALRDFAGFTSAHIQSIFTSIALLPSEMYLIYSGDENTATNIRNALNQAGLQNSIEATLRKF